MPRCTGGDPLTGAHRQYLRDGTPRSSRPLAAARGRDQYLQYPPVGTRFPSADWRAPRAAVKIGHGAQANSSPDWWPYWLPMQWTIRG